MELLEELDFTLDAPQDGIIVSRQDVVISSPAAEHSATSNQTIRLVMNGSGFLDPHSVQMYADVYFTCTTAADLAASVPTTYQIFDNIRILSGTGEVLEDIAEASLLATILHNSSSESSYLDCTGGFSNSQKDPAKRQAPSSEANKVRFRISITDILGLFNQQKLLHLPSFQGLTLELRLTNANTAGAFETDLKGVNFNYFLKNLKLHYTEVQVTQAYLDAYNQKVKSGGYAIAFPTYQHLSNNVSASGASQVALGKTCSRAKAIVSTVRIAENRTKKEKNSYATSPNISSYQYQLGGSNYPPQPVDSAAQAFHEMLKANNNVKNNTYSNVCYEDWTGEWTWAEADRQKGTRACWIDLEKSQNSPLSGTRMDASSAFLKLIQSEQTSVVVDTFVCFERLLSITDGRVSYVD